MSAQRHHTKPGYSARPEFWARYGLDLTIVLLILTGIFLLTEQTDVSAIVLGWLKTVILAASAALANVSRAIAGWFAATETSDIVGYLLILIALALLGRKFRQRMLQYFPSRSVCPQCGSSLHRIHRKVSHKIWGRLLWLQVKHYRCSNSNCNWVGIQVIRH